MIEYPRFLSQKFKNVELKKLEKVYSEAKNDDSNGNLDISLIPFLKAFNSIEGVVTIQSCIGHKKKGLDGIVYQSCANFWIWPSEKVAKVFREKAFELAAKKGIETVETRYSSWNQEIISLCFTGNEETLERILKFFIKLSFEGGVKMSGFEREKKWFWKNHKNLLKKYKGKFVVVYEEKVVASGNDQNFIALLNNFYKKYGYVECFCHLVLEEEQFYRI